MPTAKVNKTIFIELPVQAKIIYARDRVVNMTGNANFVTPVPSLATVTTVTNTLETAELAAEGGGPAQTVARDAALLVWDNTMRSLANYVDSIALGDTVKITSAGFTPTDTARTAHLAPAKPTGQKFIHTDESGAVIFTCNAVPDAESYVAVLSTDPAIPVTTVGTQLIIGGSASGPGPIPIGSPFIVIDASKDRKKTIRGLPSGNRIYAKMYCFNAAGRGLDSDVIFVMVG
ncbi:MAG: hypothetical protein HY841_10010 [Bacteroidetes bacterium]|nr:hypothetical protein [Bacteroidota bacterium]